MLTLFQLRDFGMFDVWNQSVLLLHEWDLVDRLRIVCRLPELRQHDHNANTFDLQRAFHPSSTNISS
jgi:hypothetical protein